MSTSDIKKRLYKIAFIYLVIAMLCFVIKTIYAEFSHNVYSDYMTYMFLYPLIGGFIVYGILGLITKYKNPSRIAINSYNAGIATLTIGSTIRGIFEIAGTSTPYQYLYTNIGIALIVIGIIAYFVKKDMIN